MGGQTWFQDFLPSIEVRACVLEFAYEIETPREFSWAKYLEHGNVLLDELASSYASLELHKRSLVFICHGNGGFICKQALVRLMERNDTPVFREIIDSIHGAIFLGCPHPTVNKLDPYNKLNLLLKTCTGLSNQLLQSLQGGNILVSRLSKRFESLPVQLDVISAYETAPTKTSSGFFGSKYDVIVDREAAEIGVVDEELICVDVSHFDICDIPATSALHLAIEKMLKEVPMAPPLSTYALSQIDAMSYTKWKDTDSEMGLRLGVQNSVGLSTGSSSTPYDSLRARAGSDDLYSYELIRSPTPHPVETGGQNLNLRCHLFGPQTRNADFFGRDQIFDKMDKILIPSPPQAEDETNSLRTYALTGMGGVGKTQIAVEYAYSRRNHFEAIFFVSAATGAKLAQGFSQISTKLGLEDKKSADDQVVSRDLVLQWLSNPGRTRQHSATESNSQVVSWLLILDNADDLAVLGDYWPVTGRGSVIITSRDPLALTRSYIPISQGLTVQPFSNEQGAVLLRLLTGFNASEEDVELSNAITQRLGGLPLGISHIAGIVVRRDLTLEELIKLIEDDATRKELYSSKEGFKQNDSYMQSILTSLSLGDLTASAACLLDLLALMDPDQISEEILMIIQDKTPEQTFTWPEEYPSTFQTYIEARNQLTRSSFIRRNTRTKEVTIHRLVQDSARLRMTPDRFSQILDLGINLLYQSWPFGINDYSTDRWSVCEPIFPHIQALMDSYVGRPPTEFNHTSMERFAHLLSDAGWYYLERGYPLQSLPFQEASQNIIQSLPTPNLVRLSETLHAQAEVHIYTANFQIGLDFAKQALDLCIAAEASDDKPGHRLGQAYNEMAEALANLRRLEEAIGYCDQAISTYLEQEGHFEHFESSTFARVNKAFCFWQLGRLDDAAAELAELLEYRAKMHGSNDVTSFKTGLALLTLGNVQISQGLLEEAEKSHWLAREQYHQTLGPNHYRVAGLSYTLASHLFRNGNWTRAVELLEHAVKVFSDKPFYKPELSRVLLKLVVALEHVGDKASLTRARAKLDLLFTAMTKEYGRVVDEHVVEEIVQYWAL
ncbi:unnamed protein product [Clonostachys rosea f. rosea IK726]|uniref:Uncharacterized protein n=1 Tax=Clonostachys rosea f. rosea IK726 TaxID=1349383 RepID=A0ACA9UG19_BIOOC|nr:unnamed protein product [Clonostachys rosea f. rosea IK726]